MTPATTALRDDLVSSLRELVDIPSVSEHEVELTDHLRKQIPDSFDIVFDDDSVLVAVPSQRDETKPLVFLVGHTDTVPIADNVPSRLEGDVLFGCGTCDMKAGIVAMMKLAHWWTDNRDHSAYDIGLCLFGREELGEEDNPLPAMFDQCRQIHDADLALIMEPTSNAVEVGCQGSIDVRLTFNGEAAHSARPWMGENAAHKAVLALQTLSQLPPHDVDIDGLVFREVANVVGFESGVAHNVIPPVARVDVNIRFAPDKTKEQVERWWIDNYGDVADVEIVSSSSAGAVATSNPLVGRLVEAGAHGMMPKQAWTNVADFTARNISAVNFGAGDPLYAHRADERIEVAALVENYEILLNFFRKEPTSD